MKHLITTAAAALLVLAAIPTSASDSDPTELVEAFMAQLVAGKTAAGFDALMKHSQLDELKPREMELAKGRTVQGVELYKAPSGFEQVTVTSYGSSLKRLVYITKHSQIALVWNFYFYRTSEGWTLLNWDFNDQLQKLE